MAQIATKGSGAHSDLNLVPFIDLLSTLVIFLVTTAMWTQIASIPITGDPNKKTHTSQAIHYDKFVIHVTKSGFQLSTGSPKKASGAISTQIKKVGTIYDFPRLKEAVHTFLKQGALSSATVDSDDDVDYSSVVKTIDIAKAAGFKTVGLSED